MLTSRSASASTLGRNSAQLRVRVAVGFIGALLATTGAGGFAAAQVSAASETTHNGEASRHPGVEWGAAPRWPFQGVISVVGSAGGDLLEEDAHRVPDFGGVGLGFVDALTGEVSYVRAAGDPWFCRGGRMHANSHGIVWEYGEYDSDRSWTLWVPWGDFGYPLFVRPRDASWSWGDLHGFVWPSRGGDRMQLGVGVADMPLTVAGDDAIAMATPNRSRFYLVLYERIEDRFRSGDWTGGLPGFVRDEYYAAEEVAGSVGLARRDYFIFDEDVGPESWPWWPRSVPDAYFEVDDPDNEGWFRIVFAGTDGRHYGLTVWFDEPACGGSLTYIVDSLSGEIAACGWSWVGPLLVAPPNAVSDSFVPALADPNMGNGYGDQCPSVLSLEQVSLLTRQGVDR